MARHSDPDKESFTRLQPSTACLCKRTTSHPDPRRSADPAAVFIQVIDGLAGKWCHHKAARRHAVARCTCARSSSGEQQQAHCICLGNSTRWLHRSVWKIAPAWQQHLQLPGEYVGQQDHAHLRSVGHAAHAVGARPRIGAVAGAVIPARGWDRFMIVAEGAEFTSDRTSAAWVIVSQASANEEAGGAPWQNAKTSRRIGVHMVGHNRCILAA